MKCTTRIGNTSPLSNASWVVNSPLERGARPESAPGQMANPSYLLHPACPSRRAGDSLPPLFLAAQHTNKGRAWLVARGLSSELAGSPQKGGVGTREERVRVKNKALCRQADGLGGVAYLIGFINKKDQWSFLLPPAPEGLDPRVEGGGGGGGGKWQGCKRPPSFQQHLPPCAISPSHPKDPEMHTLGFRLCKTEGRTRTAHKVSPAPTVTSTHTRSRALADTIMRKFQWGTQSRFPPRPRAPPRGAGLSKRDTHHGLQGCRGERRKVAPRPRETQRGAARAPLAPKGGERRGNPSSHRFIYQQCAAPGGGDAGRKIVSTPPGPLPPDAPAFGVPLQARGLAGG